MVVYTQLFTTFGYRTHRMCPPYSTSQPGHLKYGHWLAISLMLILSACSRDNIQQLGFYTIQNLGQSQCQKAMQTHCEKVSNYDDYQRQRKEVVQ